ncbi:GGDEF domain-containing protein [Parahaliea mediterranea]|uniref:diguanylate cyclase n=1 Tax=Parahaliea mediterranea TaxID=651086 RepID=A0A939DD83_9GAMM|nr:GGDEF domain-containing protein [Parahaliea mediterranea]MBN7795417.1 GGDEF domain-containing protein [Parahaliea mediterranea]
MAHPPIEDTRDVDFEEIEAAPPPETLAELHERHQRETLTLNRYLYNQSLQMEHMLLSAPDLQGLLEILLVNLPRHFGFSAAELWLHDPEQVLCGLLPGGDRYGQYLQLHPDVFVMQDLYDLEPDVALVDAADRRMFEVLKADDRIDQALLLPLLDNGRMMGSLHCGICDSHFAVGEAEEAHIAHLASVISLCFKNAVSRQQVSRLTMIDPLTQISNLRGFEKDIAREIARSRRANQPISVLMLEIDEYDDLYRHYGDITGQFLVKKISERISSDLRKSDYLARLNGARLAILVPGSSEVMAGDIAERIRADIEDFAVDDSRGANLQVTLSVGYVCWEPQRFPAVDMVQLARQIESAADKALAAARDQGGNRVALNRLTTLMV